MTKNQHKKKIGAQSQCGGGFFAGAQKLNRGKPSERKKKPRQENGERRKKAKKGEHKKRGLGWK